MGLFDSLFDYLNSIPFIIRSVWFICLFFTITLLLLVIGHNILRFYIFGINDKEDELYKECEILVIRFMAINTSSDGYNREQVEIIETIRKYAERSSVRKVLITCLITLIQEISGEFEQIIYDVYTQAGLKKYALKKLDDSDTYRLINGIRQLNIFHVSSALDAVKKHLNHEKQTVRNEVQLYLVNILKFKGLFFLDDLKAPLSEWNQIQILEILKNFENQDIHDISTWINSENEDVVLFALKLVRIYNLFDMQDLLIEKFIDATKEIRLQTISLLCYLHSIKGKNILKQEFELLTTEEQILFFKELHQMADVLDAEFIENYVFHEEFDVKLCAMTLLRDLDRNLFDAIKVKSEDKESIKMINYLSF